jgi:hypothetical protein
MTAFALLLVRTAADAVAVWAVLYVAGMAVWRVLL